MSDAGKLTVTVEVAHVLGKRAALCKDDNGANYIITFAQDNCVAVGKKVTLSGSVMHVVVMRCTSLGHIETAAGPNKSELNAAHGKRAGKPKRTGTKAQRLAENKAALQAQATEPCKLFVAPADMPSPVAVASTKCATCGFVSFVHVPCAVFVMDYNRKDAGCHCKLCGLSSTRHAAEKAP